jgi:rhamnosyltransferase
MNRVGLCIPVKNPGQGGVELIRSLRNQAMEISRILVLDSCSTDGSQEYFRKAGVEIQTVPEGEFDHAGTRQSGFKALFDCDIVVFLTQDTILADSDSLCTLVACLESCEAGAAFGRQLPRAGAGHIEAHARRFNYPPESRVKTVNEIACLGLKTAFISNSFAAYRRSALEAVGGFPNRCIVSEDTYVAARLLMAGWKITYCAEARVYHSHDYNCRQDFQRYFDIGVFHAREPWVRKSFGGAEGEGWRFLRSELSYLFGASPWLIPSALVRTLIKYSGFRAGLQEKSLPFWLKRRMSMQKAFWDQEMGGIQDA